jgi:hypothetical protein
MSKKKKTKMRKFAAKRMEDYYTGEMHSGRGGKKGLKQKKAVTNKKQALAIMLSEARKKGIYHGPTK